MNMKVKQDKKLWSPEVDQFIVGKLLSICRKLGV